MTFIKSLIGQSMLAQKTGMNVTSVVTAVVILTIVVSRVHGKENDFRSAQNEYDLHSILKCEDNWDLYKKPGFRITPSDDVYLATELLGAIRSEKSLDVLLHVAGNPLKNRDFSRGFKDNVVAVAVIRTIRNMDDINNILDVIAKRQLLYSGTNCLRFILPYESLKNIVDKYLQQHVSSDLETKDHLNLFRDIIKFSAHSTPESLPPLSDFVLNHPLYKARQTTIETNIAVFKERKRPTELDKKLLEAVEKLGEVRAVEAVEVLVPYLLLKVKSGLKPAEKKPDEKLAALVEYPIAMTLAEIGIPSIWGLLDEIAKREKDADEYRNIACKVMTAILPAVAIPGFVNAVLEKQTDETTKLRLAKLFPLLGVQDSPLLVPSFREWETTDGFFKTNAKFVTLTKGDVTLEKPDGKRTTIELKALRKTDQDYVNEQVKEQVKPEEK